MKESNIQSANFKIEIGEEFNDNKRNLTVTDREIRFTDNGQKWKWYKYTCNKCGWTEGWIVEHSLIDLKCGCSCCNGKKVVEGINDIPTTAPWMVKYFQGGYDEAKLYTRASNKKIYFICPDCKTIVKKPIRINLLFNYRGIRCRRCSDNISYPEKVFIGIFEQLKIKYVYQMSRLEFQWVGNYKYDFYIPSVNAIIEVHGEQHYKNKFNGLAMEAQSNDNNKYNLAMNNGINKYITIDARESNIDFIKRNIETSELKKLFNLDVIDWSKIDELAISNFVKSICDFRKMNPNMTATDISEIYNLNRNTITKYLKIGSDNGWCEYNAKEEYLKGVRKKGKNGKSVEIFKENRSLGVFKSCKELSNVSFKEFGVELNAKEISAVCLGRRKTHKGYTFKYIKN